MTRQIIITDVAKLERDSKHYTVDHDNIPSLCISDVQAIRELCDVKLLPLGYKEALGREFGLVIYDIRDGFRLQVLAAIAGCVTAEGVLLIVLPEQEKAVTNSVKSALPSSEGFIQNKSQLWQFITNKIGNVRLHKDVDLEKQRNVAAIEQADVLSQIIKTIAYTDNDVALLAGRGRGKSHLLAELAYRYLKSHKRILCLGQHAEDYQVFAKQLDLLTGIKVQRNTSHDILNGHICITALDNPTLETSWDIIIVDEAASLSLNSLEKIQNIPARHIFSTTTHGYEGSGQGFRQLFLAGHKGIEIFKLDMPFRFSYPCQIEETLTLTADSKKLLLADGIHLITGNDQSDALLQAYDLLSQAHYQTRPDDLQRLFDSPDMHCIVQVRDGQVVGVLTYFTEDLTHLDISTQQQVCNGTRRLQGHLGLQQIANTFCEVEILEQQHWRINRIAVDRRFRRQSIGTSLVSFLKQKSTLSEINALSTSFAMSNQSTSFWQNNGFHQIRLGNKGNSASANVNILMIYAPNNPVIDGLQNLSEYQIAWAMQSEHQIKLSQKIDKQDEKRLYEIIHQFMLSERNLANTEYALWALSKSRTINLKSLNVWFDTSRSKKEKLKILGCHGVHDVTKLIKEELKTKKKLVTQ